MRVWSASVLGCLLLAAPGHAAGRELEEQPPPRYRFESSAARHEGPPQPPCRLSFDSESGPREHTFPAGARIWRDEASRGYVIVDFMDRRFSAFTTSGLDFVDLDSGKRVPLLRGVIHEAPDLPDDLFVGVRRIAKEGEPLGRRLRTEYGEAVFELVVVFFDPPRRRWHTVALRTAPWLPDDNQPWPPGQPPPTLVAVEDGKLLVATDPTGTTFETVHLDELVPWSLPTRSRPE